MNKKNNKISNGVKKYFKIKSWLMLTVVLIIGISSVAIVSYFEFKKDIKITSAAELPGLVSYYNFDEASGDLIDPVSSYNMSCSGVGYGEIGILDDAYDFSGDNSNDNCAIDRAVVTVPFSVSMWVNSAGDSGDIIFNIGASEGSYNHSHAIDLRFGATNYALLWSYGIGGFRSVASDTGILTANEWHHIVGVWAADDSRTIYVDGGNDNTDTNSVTTNPLAFTKIGIAVDNNYEFDGLIDEVRLYDRALTPEEVTALYEVDEDEFNVSGHAWSENIGWISFNCSDDSSCDTANYGVNVDPTTGNLSGYAWSSNVGWISFNRKTCNGGGRAKQYCDINNTCPDGAQCSDSADGAAGAPPAEPFLIDDYVIANYDSLTEEVTGWVKILALGDDGWISFRGITRGETDLPIGLPISFPIIFGSPGSHGVSISASTDEFSGWAWNGNDTSGTGVGWVSFNCSDTVDNCVTVDYKVLVDIDFPPNATNLSAPNWGYQNACTSGALHAFLSWTFVGDTQSAYQIIVNDQPNPVSTLIVDTGKTLGPASQYHILSADLDYDEQYYWWVKVWDNNDNESEWVQYDSVTDTDNDDGNDLTFTTYEHEFPNDVDFSYFLTSPSQGEEVQFTGSATDYLGANITDWLWTADDATFDPDATVIDPIITFDSAGSNTVSLQATDSDGYYCIDSESINVNVDLPSWEEVKPR